MQVNVKGYLGGNYDKENTNFRSWETTVMKSLSAHYYYVVCFFKCMPFQTIDMFGCFSSSNIFAYSMATISHWNPRPVTKVEKFSLMFFYFFVISQNLNWVMQNSIKLLIGIRKKIGVPLGLFNKTVSCDIYSRNMENDVNFSQLPSPDADFNS